MPGPAAAYDASVGWEPAEGAAGYTLFVRYDDGVAQPTDVGLPASDGDGVVRVLVEALPLGPTAHFAVAAYDASGSTSAKSAQMAITYAQAAGVSDSDDDGLTDAEEDSDLDGRVDAGETDPRSADTDGDGYDDASELDVYGTDPLDASSTPSCTDPAGCGGDDGSGESVWIVAADDPTAARRGAMTSDADYTGGDDDDPAADSLAAQLLFPLSTSNTLSGGSGDVVEYRVTLLASGQWYLWGRFYWPGAPGSNDANSFIARVDGGAALKLGNNKDYFRKWHWGGDGARESGTPQALALGYLDGGVHTLAIEKRESVPIPPRLDLLVLTRDPAWRPTDAAALDALGDRLSGGDVTTTSSTTTTTLPPPLPPTTTTTTLPAQCSTAADCGDTDPCTVDSCVSGSCVQAAAASGACDDGDPCTVGDACSAGGCVGWALDCSHLDGPCTFGVCDASIAECTVSAVADGSRCDDGSACTAGDVCAAGVCDGTDACASSAFCDAKTKTCKARVEVWVFAAADETAAFSGAMTSGPAYTDGDDLDAAADSLEASLVFSSSTRNDMKATSGDTVSYVVELPAAGTWYLWGRFYYPGAPGSNDANSFFARIDGGAALKFGNKKDRFRRWHWDGDGRRESGTPQPLALGHLAAGEHTVTIAKREVVPIAPRLDVLVLTQDPDWLPAE